MLTEKQLLDAKIQRWERMLTRIENRLKSLRNLRAQYDADDELEHELRELLVTSDNGTPLDSTISPETPDSPEIREASTPRIDEVHYVERADEPNEVELDEGLGSDGHTQEDVQTKNKNTERQSRGKHNRTRRLILAVTVRKPLTVPAMHREMAARRWIVSKQAIDIWVKRLIEDGLLKREASEDPTAKFQYRNVRAERKAL